MMKRLVILVSCVCAVSLYAGELTAKNVPAPVKDALTKQCANADDVKWEKEGENFGVEFECGKSEMELLIDVKGIVLEKETEIAVKDLPAAAVANLSSQYPGMKIREAAKVERNGTVTYEVELANKAELILDESGAVVGEEKDDDDGDRGDHDDDDGDDD